MTDATFCLCTRKTICDNMTASTKNRKKSAVLCF